MPAELEGWKVAMSQKPRFPRPVKKETLSEQVAKAIRESILDGEWQPGEALPTEPELSELFGVSRAFVRDATRMLATQGLVVAHHGRGVFVTESQAEAFGEALLLALRRAGATAWDVEHFEQVIYPEVFALVASEATDDEIRALRHHAKRYLQIVREVHEEYEDGNHLPETGRERLAESYRDLMVAIFSATHNQVFQILAAPLLNLSNVRSWQDQDITPNELIQIEEAYFHTMLDAIASRDLGQARQVMINPMRLPPEAVVVMEKTPIGEVPEIAISVADSPRWPVRESPKSANN